MTNANDRPSPQDAETCTDLGRDEQVYDYYNAVLAGDEAREFETHLLECFTCRRKVATLDWVNATLKSEVITAIASPAAEVAVPAALASVEEADASSTDAAAATKTVEAQLPALYVVVGGLSVLGILTVVGVKLLRYTRQHYA